MPTPQAPDDVRTRRALRVAAALATGLAFVYSGAGILRYATYTNQTFDLAFYTRMAWGMPRLELWEPILDAHLFGLRLPLVLLPVAALGELVGLPEALYLAQGLAVAIASYLLGRIGARRFGVPGAIVGALALVLHPNVGHVVSFEAHPGTMALAPLALLVEALDRRDPRALVLGVVGVLICREDLALVAMLASVLFAFDAPRHRKHAALGFLLAFGYLALFVTVLHPRHRPASGSMEAHFGDFGRTPGEVLSTLLGDPQRLLRHLLAPARLTYLPRILAPLAFLPLLSPRALLLASPVLAINVISHFPTTTRIDSHYLTPALPWLVFGALEGIARLARMRPSLARTLSYVCLSTALGGSLYAGLFSTSFPTPRFVHPPVDPRALDALVAAVPAGVSAQAPDAILAHLAERRVVHRADPFRHDDEAIVLDLTHRERFAHTEDLLRTTEEPVARAMFARENRRVAAVAGPYVLLLRDRPDAARRVDRVRLPADASSAPGGASRLSDCLTLLAAHRLGGRLALDFVATAPCPVDLAVRLGAAPSPRRVDLLFEGLVSPTHLRAGDRVRSLHEDPAPAATTLHVGLLRSSGARPAPEDPVSVPIRVAPSGSPR